MAAQCRVRAQRAMWSGPMAKMDPVGLSSTAACAVLRVPCSARQNDDGSVSRESNARYVEWSDGTESIVLGDEVLTMERQAQPVANTYVHVVRYDAIQVRGGQRLKQGWLFVFGKHTHACFPPCVLSLSTLMVAFLPASPTITLSSTCGPPLLLLAVCRVWRTSRSRCS